MELLYKDVKKALPRRLDGRSDVQKVEGILQTSLSALQNEQSDEQCLQTLQSGITYLIKVLQLLLDCVPVEPPNHILSLALDCLIAANERGKKCSSFLLSSLMIHFMDVVLEDRFAFMSRMEVLSKINLVFECTDVEEKEKFVQTDTCIAKLKHLFQLIFDIGDYEFQVCIMEVLFRLLPRKLRQKYSSEFVGKPEVLRAFLTVKDSCFEVDCRDFLNSLNLTPREQDRRVCSFPCHKITFGSIELQKPSDDGYSDFWLDVNLGSRRMVIFCENAHLSSQASVSEDCWDTVSVWSADILKFTCHEEGGVLHTRVDIKATAKCVPGGFDSHPVLHIMTDPKHRLQAALTKIAGQASAPVMKVSDVTRPIQFMTEHSSQVSAQCSQGLDSTDEEEQQERSARGQNIPRPAGTGGNTVKVSQSVSADPEQCKKKPVKVSTPSGSAVRSYSGDAQWWKVLVPSDVMATPVRSAPVRSSSGSGRENTRRAGALHTHVTPSRKKVKTPVVMVHKPATASGKKDSRGTPSDKGDSRTASSDGRGSRVKSDKTVPRMPEPSKPDSRTTSDKVAPRMTAPSKNDSRRTTRTSVDTAVAVSAETDVAETVPVTGMTPSAGGDSRKISPSETDMKTTAPAKRDSRMASSDKKDSRIASSDKKDSRMASSDKKDSRMASSDKKDSRMASSDKDSRNTSSDKKDSRMSSSDKRDSRITLPAKRDLGTAQTDGCSGGGRKDPGVAPLAPKQTRRGAKAKFVPPVPSCSGDAASAQPQFYTGQRGEKVVMEESPPNIVIPDSLPFLSQVVKPSQPGSSKKSYRQKRGKDADSQKEHTQLSSCLEAAATKPSKTPRSQLSEQLDNLPKSQEVTDSSHGKTLRSSQRNMAPILSSAGDGPHPPQKPDSKPPHKKKTVEPTQDASQRKKLHVDSVDTHTSFVDSVPDEIETIPSSFEEFKVPKSKKSSKRPTKKAASDFHPSQRDTRGTQAAKSTQNSQRDKATKKISQSQEGKKLPKNSQSEEGKKLPKNSQREEAKQLPKNSQREEAKQLPKNLQREEAKQLPKDGNVTEREKNRRGVEDSVGSVHQSQKTRSQRLQEKKNLQDRSSDECNGEALHATSQKIHLQDRSAVEGKDEAQHATGQKNPVTEKKGKSHGMNSKTDDTSKSSCQRRSEQKLAVSSTTDESGILTDSSTEKLKNKEQKGIGSEKHKTLETIGACSVNPKVTESVEKRKRKDCKNTSNVEDHNETFSSSSLEVRENSHRAAEKHLSSDIGSETDACKKSKKIEKRNASAMNNFYDEENILDDSQNSHCGQSTGVSNHSLHEKPIQQSSGKNSDNNTSEWEAYDFEVETDAGKDTEHDQQGEGLTKGTEHSTVGKLNSTKKNATPVGTKTHSGGLTKNTEHCLEKVDSAKKNETSVGKKTRSGQSSTDGSRKQNDKDGSRKESDKDFSVTISPAEQKKCDRKSRGHKDIPSVDRYQDSEGDSSDQIDLIQSDSGDDDTTDFRFDLDTSNETPSKTVKAGKTPCKPRRSKTAEAKKQRKEAGALPQREISALHKHAEDVGLESSDNDDLHQGKKTYSRKKPKGKTSELSDGCQKDITAQKDKSDRVGEDSTNGKDSVTKGKKESTRKSKEKASLYSNTSQKDQPSGHTGKTVSPYTKSTNRKPETSPEQVLNQRSTSPRSLRKRLPKSYRETDSVEDLDLNGNDRTVRRNQNMAASLISDRKFMFSKSEERNPGGGRFVQKTFAVSISSIHTDQVRMYSPSAVDPYNFDEECRENPSQGKLGRKSLPDTGTKKKPATGSKLRNWEKLAATRNAAFSWDEDDDDDDDDNDADAEGSQESEKERRGGYLALNGLSPVSKRPWLCGPCQKQTSAHRQLLHSQLPPSTHSESGHGRGSAAPSSLQDWGRTSERGENQDPWRTAVSREVLNGKENRKPDSQESPYADTVIGSPMALKVTKHKAHPCSEQRTKRTKHNPGPSISPVNSAVSLPCTLYKTSERSHSGTVNSLRTGERGSHSGMVHTMQTRGMSHSGMVPTMQTMEMSHSGMVHTMQNGERGCHSGMVPTKPKGRSSAMTPAARNRKNFNPLDIGHFTSTTGWNAREILSDGDARSSAKSKAVDIEEELSPLAQMKAMESLDKSDVGGEISPSSSQTSVPLALEADTPVSLFSKKAGKLKKGDSTKRGLLSGSLQTRHAIETPLDGEHKTGNNSVASDDEDDVTAVFTQAWGRQTKDWFPHPAGSPPELLTGVSQRKRKHQHELPAPQPAEKASRRACSLSGVRTPMDLEPPGGVGSEDEEEEDDLEMEEGGTQPGGTQHLGMVPQPVAGVSSLLHGFGLDMEKHMKVRENQVQELAKGALKLSSRRISNLWTSSRSKRVEVFSSFRERVHSELCDLEQDVTMMAEREKTVETTFLSQLNILREQREKLQNRVKSVMECHEDLKMDTEQVEDQSHEARRWLEVQMKQDIDQLKSKLLLDMQHQQLKRMKDSCLKHFI